MEHQKKKQTTQETDGSTLTVVGATTPAAASGEGPMLSIIYANFVRYTYLHRLHSIRWIFVHGGNI